MKRSIFLPLLVVSLIMLSGCATVKVYSNSDLKKETGLRFYTLKPYLLVEYMADKDNTVKTTVVYLPDLSSPQFMVLKSGIGSSELKMSFKNSALESYGVVTLLNANATPWAYVIFNFGGKYISPANDSLLNTPEWVKAMDWYAGMLKRFAPPGVVNFNWYECSSSFMQGQVATYYDGVNSANQFEDSAKSKIAGKVGYAVLPSGPAGPVTPTFTNAMAVSAQSRNKEAAYLFIQWATNKKNFIRELLAGVGVVLYVLPGVSPR